MRGVGQATVRGGTKRCATKFNRVCSTSLGQTHSKELASWNTCWQHPHGFGPRRPLMERTGANDDAYLEHDNSAFCALTDFHRDYLITMEADGSIDDALADMNRL
jgi:hypothetical protein